MEKWKDKPKKKNISNTIKRFWLCLCLFVCLSRSLLSSIMSIWKAGGIIRTVSAMACYILSFTKFHAISHKFHAILAISAISGPISTYWVSKSMYSSLETHWWYFHAISRMCSRNFMQISCNFTQFGLFQPFLGQFQHVGYQKACTQAEKFIGGIGRGLRPQVGAEGPKKRPKASKWGQRPPTALGRS